MRYANQDAFRAILFFSFLTLFISACQNQGNKAGQDAVTGETMNPTQGFDELSDQLDNAAAEADGEEAAALSDAADSVDSLSSATNQAANSNGRNGGTLERLLEQAMERIKGSGDRLQDVGYEQLAQAFFRIYYTRNIYRWRHPNGMFAYTRNLHSDAQGFIQGGFQFRGIAFRAFKEQRGPELQFTVPLVPVYRCHRPGAKWVITTDANCEGGQTNDRVLLGNLSGAQTQYSVFAIYRTILPNNENASVSYPGYIARINGTFEGSGVRWEGKGVMGFSAN